MNGVKGMSRLLVLLCLLAALSACGFRPRASLALADDIGPVKVVTADPYSPMAQGLSVGQSAEALCTRSE